MPVDGAQPTATVRPRQVRPTVLTVTVADYIPQGLGAAVPSVEAKAAALAFPTRFGPDNIPPLEAFAQDSPVVASRVDGAEEQLGDAALLFDPASPEVIARQLAAVLAIAALRSTLMERGRARVAKRAPQA